MGPRVCGAHTVSPQPCIGSSKRRAWRACESGSGWLHSTHSEVAKLEEYACTDSALLKLPVGYWRRDQEEWACEVYRAIECHDMRMPIWRQVGRAPVGEMRKRARCRGRDWRRGERGAGFGRRNPTRATSQYQRSRSDDGYATATWRSWQSLPMPLR